MGSACAKAGVAALAPAEAEDHEPSKRVAQPSPPVAQQAQASSMPRRSSERRGLRHGLAHAGRRVWDHYTVEREIGHGMTGKVYLVRAKETGELFALKSMDLRRLDVTSHELLEDLKAEVETLRSLDHPHVIKLFEYFVEPASGGPVQSMYLVLEYCSGGEVGARAMLGSHRLHSHTSPNLQLFDRLHAQPGSRFTEAEAAFLVNQMVAAVAYIHGQGITHRDLKLENFIFTDGSDTMRSALKLIDFGLSARYQYTGSAVKRMTTLCGTPYYLAPEVLNQGEGGSGYTNAVDEWSLGVITYMLLSGTPPFKGRRDREVLQAVRRGKYTLSGPRWDGISEEAKDFIRRLLVYNPSKRATSEQAMKHPWLLAARARQTAQNGVATLDADIVNSLREYRTMTVFKRAALEAIAFSMSTSSLAHLRDAFLTVDSGGTGSVTLGEFTQVLKEAGIGREEASAIFQSIAPARSTTISYSEFLAATLNKRALRDATIRAAFSRLDVDGSGVITRDNLHVVMGDDWSREAEDAFFKEADVNQDGVVSAEEFIAALTRAFGPSIPGSAPSAIIDARVGQGGSIVPPALPSASEFITKQSPVLGGVARGTSIPSSAIAMGSTGGTPGTLAEGMPPRQASRHLSIRAAEQASSVAFSSTSGKAAGPSFRVAARQRHPSDDDVRLLQATGDKTQPDTQTLDIPLGQELVVEQPVVIN